MRTASISAPSRARLVAPALAACVIAASAACNTTSARTNDSAGGKTPDAPATVSPGAAAAPNAATPTLVVYKTPSCGCCKGWVKAMESAGFTVEVHDLADLSATKQAAGVPTELQACHTARIGGYVVEGHVPAEDIRRLLADRPDIAGIGTPGMPVGSPGMEGPYKDRYDVMTFGTDGRTTVFASH